MITESQLTGFLSMHAGFRTEFGRLAEAFTIPGDDRRVALLEEHLALVLDILHAHHTHEDDHLWPHLIDAAPQAADDLAALEAEHDVLDPLIRSVADTTVATADRARDLAALHRLVNDHLDHEERVAVPLMLAHLEPADIERDRRKALTEIGRRRMPTVFGWIASCLDDAHLEATLAEQPRLVRVLFRRFWWPAYVQRMQAMYGQAAA